MLRCIQIILLTFVCLIFAEEDDKTLQKAMLGGKYSNLIKSTTVPEDRKQYGDFMDAGFYKAMHYAKQDMPAGYWVYVFPKWYIFKNRDLEKIGFKVLKSTVQMQKGPLEVHFEYHKNNQAWAKRLLALSVKVLPDLEKRVGIPFPGYNPYVIYEDPTLKTLGLAGPTSMALVAPERAEEWTLLHELTHIWNAGNSPDWICEGLANYISYQYMIEYEIAFKKNYSMPFWIDRWRDDRKRGRDIPMNDPKDNYSFNKQGKAMEYWHLLYEQFGNDFIDEAYKRNAKDKNFSNEEFAALLKKYGVKDTKKYMSGWLMKGNYHIKSAKTKGKMGKVRE